MPYYTGSLREIMEAEGRLDEIQSTMISIHILSGLYNAFKKYGIVHQDIKPENVLSDNTIYNDDNMYFISDWGISNLQNYYHPREPEMDNEPSAIFQTLSRMGTLPYMSPERLLSHPSDIRSDIYSLGIMFFEMLFGYPPFDPKSNKELVYQILEADYYYIADSLLKRDCDNKIGKIILKCIHPEPRKRYKNHDNLVLDLGKFLRKKKKFS